MSEDSAMYFERRLAVLEERTRPKTKTIFDRIKEWSGVLTFVIAVLYTYPLGVWDRFIVTAKEQREKEIDELRTTIGKLVATDSEAFRTIPTLVQSQQQALYAQAMNAQKNALLAPKIPLIALHLSALSAPELELLGYELNFMGDQGELVDRILEAASAKAIANKNNIAAADIYRIRAQLYTNFGSLGPDASKARANFTKAVELLLIADPNKAQPVVLATALDWASFEALSGTWQCFEVLAAWNILQAQHYNPQYATELQTQVGGMRIAHQQATAGTTPPSLQPASQADTRCPRNILPWNIVGWPWQVAR
jgi:hypothetical protein